MKLDVELISQTPHTQECAIAGLAMLFRYYGKKRSYGEIKKDVSLDKIGAYTPQFGSYLIKHGFEVALITSHPSLFLLKEEGMSQKDVRKRLEEKKEGANEQGVKVLLSF